MNWDALGALAELLGATAVFATLVYLAISIRDSTKVAKLSAAQIYRQQRIQWYTDQRDSPVHAKLLAKFRSGQDLTSEEEIQWISNLSAHWAMVYSEWVQRDLGIATEYLPGDLAIRLMLEHEHNREWFDTYATGLYPERFIDYVRNLIEQVDEGDT